MTKILLLGDSIRMSYEPHAAKLLAGKAVVAGPAENCQYSQFTLQSLDKWISELGKPDVIHWNNGLHDCGHNPDRSPIQIPIETYRANLENILKKLKTYTTLIIWATTTPVHPQRPFLKDQWSWRNEEIDNFNSVALEIMKEHNVPVNDLHSLVSSNFNQFLSEDMLHLSPAGQKNCGQQVVESIFNLLLGENS